MVSWSDEAASFRDLVTSRAGLGFVVAVSIWTAGIAASSGGLIEMMVAVSSVSSVALLLIAPLAYYLQRDTLMWAVTRPAIVGGIMIVVFGIGGGITGAVSASGNPAQESLVGLFAVTGACLVMTAIPAVIAFFAVMAIHGSGGRSEGPDVFPEE